MDSTILMWELFEAKTETIKPKMVGQRNEFDYMQEQLGSLIIGDGEEDEYEDYIEYDWF